MQRKMGTVMGTVTVTITSTSSLQKFFVEELSALAFRRFAGLG